MDDTNKFRVLYQHLRTIATCQEITGELRTLSLDHADDIFRIFPEVLDGPEREDFHGITYIEGELMIEGVAYTSTYINDDRWDTFKNAVMDPTPKKIQAIKAMREMTSLGLKESKTIVDDLFGRIGI